MQFMFSFGKYLDQLLFVALIGQLFLWGIV